MSRDNHFGNEPLSHYYIKGLAFYISTLLQPSNSTQSAKNPNSTDQFSNELSISIKQFIYLLNEQLTLFLPHIVLTTIYISRLRSAVTQNQHSHSIHKHKIDTLQVNVLLAIALQLAMKYLNDIPFKNSTIATISGITTKEFNTLESASLALLKCELYVSPEEYKKQIHHILIKLIKSNFFRPALKEVSMPSDKTNTSKTTTKNTL